ncbi:hypothetical protein [Burkholderia ubonensis]|nr:hypothetical protein [Burkholderia ubonensis]
MASLDEAVALAARLTDADGARGVAGSPGVTRAAVHDVRHCRRRRTAR